MKEKQQRTAVSVLRVDMIRVMKLAIQSGQADETDKALWKVILETLEKDCAAIYLMD